VADQPIFNIIGERVALGPLRRDLIPLYARWRNDFAIQITFGNPLRPVTIEEQTRWFDGQASSDARWFTIYEHETQRPIGTTDLFDIEYRYRACEFGILIGEADARGKGYGAEATRLMLDYAFTALGMHNVMLRVAEYNPAGVRAYQKAGFREFGRRRQSDRVNGVYYDEIYMDCLATEFESPVLSHVLAPDVSR
jgi:RimJ/RimL family protein N-acetyltransferase